MVASISRSVPTTWPSKLLGWETGKLKAQEIHEANVLLAQNPAALQLNVNALHSMWQLLDGMSRAEHCKLWNSAPVFLPQKGYRKYKTSSFASDQEKGQPCQVGLEDKALGLQQVYL